MKDSPRVLGLCLEAKEIVGKQLEIGKYFLLELALAGEMLKKISKMAEPFLERNSEVRTERLGKVVIGTEDAMAAVNLSQGMDGSPK